MRSLRAVTKRLALSTRAVKVLAFSVLAAGVATGFSGPGADGVTALSVGPEMTLDISQSGFCAGDQCYAETGSTFEMSVALLSPPAAGYVLLQTSLDYANFDGTASEDGSGPGTCSDGIDNGSLDGADRLDDDCVTIELAFLPALAPEDEIIWPDLDPAIALRSESGPGLVSHGGMTGLLPPLPVSNHEGGVLALAFSCSSGPSSTEVDILPYEDPAVGTQGALLREGDSPDLTFTVPKLSGITLHCVDPQAHPGDTDGDGCSDAREQGANPALGGDRDWLNPWDFYDVASFGGVPQPDGVIDLANDILGVINHAGSAPGPPYDAHYDRGPWTGLNSWNGTTGPDGVIDLPTDISGVMAQGNHTCV